MRRWVCLSLVALLLLMARPASAIDPKTAAKFWRLVSRPRDWLPMTRSPEGVYRRTPFGQTLVTVDLPRRWHRSGIVFGQALLKVPGGHEVHRFFLSRRGVEVEGRYWVGSGHPLVRKVQTSW
jgi:hypothetical protein